MATATLPVRATRRPTEELYRFSVAQYMKLIGEGFFGYDTRTELINGLVIHKMVRHPPHDSTIAFLTRWLVPLLVGTEWEPRCQLSLVLARSVPAPDFAIVRGPAEKYRRKHPRAADTLLVIEVAEDSLDTDRRDKGTAYAVARIPEYWIVNLVDFQVEVYTQPRGGKTPGYRQRKDYSGKDAVPLVLDGKVIAKLPISELFDDLMTE
jgi:Uma2 family endonuclease